MRTTYYDYTACIADGVDVPRQVSQIGYGFLATGILALSLFATPALLRAAGPPPVDLRSAASFTILSGAGITTTGGGTIGGDVGASPITGAAIGVTDEQVNGTIYAVDAAGPPGSVIDPALLLAAKGDLTTAYNYAAGLTPVPSGPFLNPGNGNLGGLVLVPGLYKFTATALITGSDLTLVGGPSDVWIFQIAADLQVGNGIKVLLAGGAQARNIFWQVGTSAVLGTTSVLNGTILADQAITMNTGSSMNGRALAFGAGVVYNGSSGLLPENPYADFGDAPDDEHYRFPTHDLTSNSRVMGRGIHHFQTGHEYFGTTVTAEAGAMDLNDPDGLPNLVDNDSDEGLLGISFLPVGDSAVPFSGTTGQTFLMEATVAVTVPAGAPAGPRFINVLVDTNRDQTWQNTHEGQEWVVANYQVDISPGTSQTIKLALDTITTNPAPRPADMWMRMTLTDKELVKSRYDGVGGWDGSGAFIRGETEDYLLFSAAAPDVCLVAEPPAVACEADFKVRINTPTLVLNEDQTGMVDLVITVAGADAYAVVQSLTADASAAPIAGIGISKVVSPGEVGTLMPALNTPLMAGVHHVRVPVGPFQVNGSGVTQSFGLSFLVSGYDCAGERVFGATSTAGVIVIHPEVGVTVRTATLSYGPGATHAAETPVALQPAEGDPIGFVSFGARQDTTGTIYAVQVTDYPPGLPTERESGTLRLTTFLENFSNVEAGTADWERRTQITGLGFAGYDSATLADAGVTDETKLVAYRYSTIPHSYFDAYSERSDAGVSTSVDMALHRVNVQDPFGFSYYSIGLKELPTSQVSGWMLY